MIDIQADRQRPDQGKAGIPSEPIEPADMGQPVSVNADAAAPREGGDIDSQGSNSGTIKQSCGGVEGHAGGISREVTIGDMPGGRPSGTAALRADPDQPQPVVEASPQDLSRSDRGWQRVGDVAQRMVADPKVRG